MKDSDFRWLGCGFLALWVAVAIASLAGIGVVIWGIVELVEHFA